jgi:hypothetical protein
MAALTRDHIIAPPLFLPLASRCLGMMAHTIPQEPAAAFHQRMLARLARAGAGIERHFRQLKPGDGVTLLRHSYALIIGLWQLYGAKGDALRCPATGLTLEGAGDAFKFTYPDDLQRALDDLWRGALGAASEGEAR